MEKNKVHFAITEVIPKLMLKPTAPDRLAQAGAGSALVTCNFRN